MRLSVLDTDIKAIGPGPIVRHMNLDVAQIMRGEPAL
jgi:hypothetical protein